MNPEYILILLVKLSMILYPPDQWYSNENRALLEVEGYLQILGILSKQN